MDDLPEYKLYRQVRKSIRLILQTNGKFAVYAPKRTPKKDIDEMVRKNYRNLLKNHENRQKALFSANAYQIKLPFFGKSCPLIMDASAKSSLIFKDGTFYSAEIDKEKLLVLYREFLREHTAQIVKTYAEEIACTHSFKYQKITVKAIYSRFGSCSAKGNLNFSLSLAAFEPSFIRFVVCHELCHTLHLNHGKDFYSLLDTVCPDHRAIKATGAKERSEILKAIHYRPA